jgi:hypothetical protein
MKFAQNVQFIFCLQMKFYFHCYNLGTLFENISAKSDSSNRLYIGGLRVLRGRVVGDGGHRRGSQRFHHPSDPQVSPRDNPTTFEFSTTYLQRLRWDRLERSLGYSWCCKFL